MANLVPSKIIAVTKYLARRAVELAHSHANQTVLDQITEVPGATSFSGTLDNITEGTTNKHFTSTEKTKLTNVEANANNYSHPENHSPSIITQDTNNRFVTDTEKTTWNNKLSSETSHSDVLVDADIGVTVQALLVSGSNIKTINGQSLLGSEDIAVSGSSPTSWGKYF